MQGDVLTRDDLYKRSPKVHAKMGLQMIFSGDFKSHSRSVHQKHLPVHHTGLRPCDRLWPWALASRFARVLAHRVFQCWNGIYTVENVGSDKEHEGRVPQRRIGTAGIETASLLPTQWNAASASGLQTNKAKAGKPCHAGTSFMSSASQRCAAGATLVGDLSVAPPTPTSSRQLRGNQ